MDLTWLREVKEVLTKHRVKRTSTQIVQNLTEVFALSDSRSHSDDLVSIAHQLGGKRGNSSSSTAVKKRKQRMIEEVVRSVNLVSNERLYGSPISRAEVLVRNHISLATLLRNEGYHVSAEKTLMHALESCERFQLTSLSIDVMTMLMDIAALHNQKRLFKKYQSRIELAVSLQVKEVESRCLENRARLLIHSYASTPKKVFSELEDSISRLRSLDNGTTSFTIRTARYRVELYTASLIGDPNRMMQVASIASDWLRDNNDAATTGCLLEFNGALMSSSFMLGDYPNSHPAKWSAPLR